MTKHPRCTQCNHLESLHKYKAKYFECELCNCRIQDDVIIEPDEVDEKDSAKYWAELDR